MLTVTILPSLSDVSRADQMLPPNTASSDTHTSAMNQAAMRAAELRLRRAGAAEVGDDEAGFMAKGRNEKKEWGVGRYSTFPRDAVGSDGFERED
jgi:hypothetical protein